MKAWRRRSTARSAGVVVCPWTPSSVVASVVDGDLAIAWTFGGSEVGLDHWEVQLWFDEGLGFSLVSQEFPGPAARTQNFGSSGTGDYYAVVIGVAEVGDPCPGVQSNTVAHG